MRVVSRAPGHYLATQPRIFIHLEHVNARMRHACVDRLLQRLLPACFSLVRQPGNQVNIDVRNPRRPQPLDLFQRDLSRMQTRHARRLLVDKRLHAQAHAIHATREQRLDHFGRKRSRRALNCDLRVVRNHKLTANRCEQPLQLRRLQQSRSSTTEINRIRLALDHSTHLRHTLLEALYVFADAIDIASEHRLREHARGEVTVAAFGFAERNRDVDPQRHLLDYRLISGGVPGSRFGPN